MERSTAIGYVRPLFYHAAITIGTTSQRSAYLLRMPDELKLMLKARAKRNGRTMNAEVCIILQRAVRDGYRLSLED